MKPRFDVFRWSLRPSWTLPVLFMGFSLAGSTFALPFIGIVSAGAAETAQFYVAATSPDGTLTAERSTQRQFRVRSGEQVLWQRDDLKISDHQTAIFSPDSRLVVTLGWQTQLWEARSGVLKATLHTSDFPTIAGSIASDGHTLAAGSWDNILRFWNIETGEALAEWKDAGGAVQQVQWLDDGKSLLLSLYSNRTDKLRAKAVANALLSSGGFTRRAYPSGQQLWKAMPHEDEVSEVVFAPDGQQMLSSGRDGQVFLWNMATGDNRLVDITAPRFFGARMDFSSDGQLALVAWGREARIYRLPSLELAGALDLPGWKQVRFSPDVKFVTDPQTKQQVGLEQIFALKGQPFQIANPNQEATELIVSDNAKPYLRRRLEGWRHLAVASGGEFIAALPMNSTDPYVYFWDTALTRITRRFRHPLTAVDTLDIAPDGKTLWMRGPVGNEDLRQSAQRVAALNLVNGEAKLLAGSPLPTRFTPQTTTAVSPDYSRLTYMVVERRPEAAAKVKARQPLTAQDYSYELRVVDVQSGTLLWKWQDAPLQEAVALALGPLRDGQTDCVILRAQTPVADDAAPQYGLTAYRIQNDPLAANLPLAAPPEGPKKLWEINKVEWPADVSSLMFSISPDGQSLATSGGMREAASGQLRYALPASQVGLWSSDSRTIALSNGTHVQWLNVQTGKVQTDVPAVGKLISISAEGSYLATLINVNTSLLWVTRPQTALQK